MMRRVDLAESVVLTASGSRGFSTVSSAAGSSRRRPARPTRASRTRSSPSRARAALEAGATHLAGVEELFTGRFSGERARDARRAVLTAAALGKDCSASAPAASSMPVYWKPRYPTRVMRERAFADAFDSPASGCSRRGAATRSLLERLRAPSPARLTQRAGRAGRGAGARARCSRRARRRSVAAERVDVAHVAVDHALALRVEADVGEALRGLADGNVHDPTGAAGTIPRQAPGVGVDRDGTRLGQRLEAERQRAEPGTVWSGREDTHSRLTPGSPAVVVEAEADPVGTPEPAHRSGTRCGRS